MWRMIFSLFIISISVVFVRAERECAVLTSEKPTSSPLYIPLNWFHIVDYYSHSSTHSWFCGPKENTKYEDHYSLGYETALVSPRLNLDQGAKKITLSFWHDLDTSNDYNGNDICTVMIQSDQTQPKIVYERNSPYDTSGWKKESIDLTRFRGNTNFVIKFIFSPDEDTNVDNGWYIDDVLIEMQLSQVDLISVVEFDTYLPTDWSQTPQFEDTNDWHQFNFNMDMIARRYYQPYETNSIDELISPIVNSTYFTTLNIQYWTLYDVGAPEQNFHHAQVLGSIDGGITWPYEIKYYSFDNFMGNENLNITSWACGKNSLRFKFRLECKAADNVYTWALDSIKVYGDLTKKVVDHTVENGREGWRTIPPEAVIETTSIGNVKAIFK
ncbi:MAG: hypothetical protein ACUVWP_02545 [bacterium]